MHIRVKRRNVTIFVDVQPDETVLEVKQRIQELTDKKPEDQKLVLEGKVLADAKTLTELKVDNDAIVALCFKVFGGEEVFEDVRIDSFDVLPQATSS